VTRTQAAESEDAPVRVTVVMTHPIQYFSPWFRWMSEQPCGLDVTVLYAAVPRPSQQGKAFGEVFEWDSRPLEGYRYDVCAPPDGMTFTDDGFWGVDVSDVGERIVRTRPDVVLISGWHSAFQVRALLACWRRGIPAIYRGDTNLSSAPRGVSRWLWGLRVRLLLRLFHGWLSVGTRAGEFLRSFSVPANRIEPSPHCVDHAWFMARARDAREGAHRNSLRARLGLAPDDFAVLFAGRLIPVKRPLDAVWSLQRFGSGAALIVAGTGPLADDIRDEARRCDVRLVTAGFRNQSEMVDLYAAADVLILPSASETWGLVVNEALASGVPCVVSAGVAAGIDLIREGQNGHVVPVGDADALAGALARVRDGLTAGRYGVSACQAVVAGAGFREASAGLLAISRRVLGSPSGRGKSLYRG